MIKKIFHERKVLKNAPKLNKIHQIIIENHNYMLGSTIASIIFTFGTKLGFFLARSTFLLAHTSLWPERSVATT